MEPELSGNLLVRWRTGDQRAAEELFTRYAGRLVMLTRSRLPANMSNRFDPEDVVQSVFRSFFARAHAGQFSAQEGADLWRLLVAITLHKLYKQVRRNKAGKRDVNRERKTDAAGDVGAIVEHVLDREPSPLEAIALSDQLEAVLRPLDPEHRRVLELRLQGYNLHEIAAETHRCERTVRRVLDGIKEGLKQWDIES